jgi:hypothetical protein
MSGTVLPVASSIDWHEEAKFLPRSMLGFQVFTGSLSVGGATSPSHSKRSLPYSSTAFPCGSEITFGPGEAPDVLTQPHAGLVT